MANVEDGSTYPIPTDRTRIALTHAIIDTEQRRLYRAINRQSDRGLVCGTAWQ